MFHSLYVHLSDKANRYCMVSARLAVNSGVFDFTSQYVNTCLQLLPLTIYYIFLTNYPICGQPVIQSPILQHIFPRFQISCQRFTCFRHHRGHLRYIISSLPLTNDLNGLTYYQTLLNNQLVDSDMCRTHPDVQPQDSANPS